MIESGIDNLLKNCLRIKPGEEVTIIADKFHEDIVSMIERRCKKINILYKIIVSDEIREGKTLPTTIDKILRGEEYNILLFVLSSSIWHFEARKSAKYDLGKRIVQIYSPPSQIDVGAACVEIDKLKNLSSTLFETLKNTRKIIVESVNGTKLESTAGQWFYETGDYSLPGSGGDFPPGEIGIWPEEGSVNGTVVFDVKMQHVGMAIDKPITLIIDNDEVVDIRGGYVSDIRKIIKKYVELRWLSEIAIGLNPYTRQDMNDIAHITEEKTAGTAHCGFGANSSFIRGSRIGRHLDAVMSKPSLRADNIQVLCDGKFDRQLLGGYITEWLEGFNLIF